MTDKERAVIDAAKECRKIKIARDLAYVKTNLEYASSDELDWETRYKIKMASTVYEHLKYELTMAEHRLYSAIAELEGGE